MSKKKKKKAEIKQSEIPKEFQEIMNAKEPMTRAELRAIKDKMALSITGFFDKYPLFYHLVSSIPKIATEKLPMPTMGVGFIRGSIPALFYHPRFVDKLNLTQIGVILHHEARHLGYRHIQRGNQLIAEKLIDGDIDEGSKRRIYNIAADVIVNNNLPDLDSLPDWLRNGLVYQNKFDFLKNVDLREMTSEEIYYKLLENAEKVEIQMQSVGQGQSGDGSFDYHGGWGDKDGDGEEGSEGKDSKKGGKKKALSSEQEAALDDLLKDAVKQLGGRHPGQVPGEIERLVDKLRQVRFDWRKQIDIFAQSVTQDDRVGTWKRLNRRLPFASPGRKRVYKPKLLVVLDNSGSTHTVYDIFIAHIAKISKYVEIDAIGVDTRVNWEFKFKDGKIPTNFEDKSSGGGTSFQPAFDYAKEKGGYNGIVYLTDGYNFDPMLSTHGIPVLFAICPGGKHMEGFRNIDISVEAEEL